MAIEIVEWKDEGSYWPWLLAFPESVVAGQGLPSTPKTLWDAFRCGETEVSDKDGEVWAWGQHWGHHRDLLQEDTAYAKRFGSRA